MKKSYIVKAYSESFIIVCNSEQDNLDLINYCHNNCLDFSSLHNVGNIKGLPEISFKDWVNL